MLILFFSSRSVFFLGKCIYSQKKRTSPHTPCQRHSISLAMLSVWVSFARKKTKANFYTQRSSFNFFFFSAKTTYMYRQTSLFSLTVYQVHNVSFRCRALYILCFSRLPKKTNETKLEVYLYRSENFAHLKTFPRCFYGEEIFISILTLTFLVFIDALASLSCVIISLVKIAFKLRFAKPLATMSIITKQTSNKWLHNVDSETIVKCIWWKADESQLRGENESNA